jgi:hypothetical protein
MDVDIHRPGRFVWERWGRSYTTNFGPFRASVRKFGRQGVNLFWRVEDIFGAHWFDQKQHASADFAILEAERIVLREAAKIPAYVKAADQRRRKAKARPA